MMRRQKVLRGEMIFHWGDLLKEEIVLNKVGRKTAGKLAIALAVIFMSSQAGAQPMTGDTFVSCLLISKDRERLACYDAAARRMSEVRKDSVDVPVRTVRAPPRSSGMVANDTKPDQVPASRSSADAASVKDDKSAFVANDSFGAERLSERQEKQIKEIRAVAISISRNRFGKYIIVLDDGQVWRQINADKKRLPLKAEDGSEVIIKRRSLGSYGLRVPTSKRTIIVKRIK